jgi:hypothetical protein
MVRRKRMGAHNALDELLPGPPPARPSFEASRAAGNLARSTHPAPGLPKRTARPKRMGPYNALDDLLPGPGSGPEPAGFGWPGLDWGPAAGSAGEAVPGRPVRASSRGRAGVYDALDDLLPGPAAPAARPARVRASFSVPPDVLEAIRDAAAHLSAGPSRVTLAELAERALRAEVERLAAAHNRGRPFPPRPGR